MAIYGIADEIGDYLAANTPSPPLTTPLTVGSNLFVSGHMPDQPDAAVGVFEYGGGPPLATMDAGCKIDQPTCQILVRDLAYSSGIITIYEMLKVLQDLTEKTMPHGSLIHRLFALQSPVHLGRDARQRHEWRLNFRALWDNPNR